jgi:hypothetical protein
MAAQYVCPTCNELFEYQHNPFQTGSHCECDCPHCNQTLAWDEPEVPGQAQSPNSILLTGPQRCTHGPDRRKRLNGLVPSLRSNCPPLTLPWGHVAARWFCASETAGCEPAVLFSTA